MLDKHRIIIEETASVAFDAIELRSEDTHPLRPPTVTAFKSIIDLHQKLFKAHDAVYAHLRLINPTSVDKRETRDRITVMRKLWCEMDLSITPKAHLIFEHTADDQEKYNGIG